MFGNVLEICYFAIFVRVVTIETEYKNMHFICIKTV